LVVHDDVRAGKTAYNGDNRRPLKRGGAQMEIWGVQIPIDYVVVGGAVLIACATYIITWGTRKTQQRYLQGFQLYEDRIRGTGGERFLPWTMRYDRKLRARKLIAIANAVTTVATLLPLISAIVALLRERPDLALQLGVFGLITLIVTKGGLWLLTSLPGWIGSGITGFYVRRALERAHKQREPAEKK
jgi:hypothetical protein